MNREEAMKFLEQKKQSEQSLAESKAWHSINAHNEKDKKEKELEAKIHGAKADGFREAEMIVRSIELKKKKGKP